MSPCRCGRTGPRVRCIGRTDDMLIVRGVNVFPSAIREVVSAFAPAVSGHIVVKPETRGRAAAAAASRERRARAGRSRQTTRSRKRFGNGCERRSSSRRASSSWRGGAWSAASTSRSSSSTRERRSAHVGRRELSPARLADRPRRGSATGCHREFERASSGASRSRSSRRRRTTRRASPCGTWSAPAST